MKNYQVFNLLFLFLAVFVRLTNFSYAALEIDIIDALDRSDIVAIVSIADESLPAHSVRVQGLNSYVVEFAVEDVLYKSGRMPLGLSIDTVDVRFVNYPVTNFSRYLIFATITRPHCEGIDGGALFRPTHLGLSSWSDVDIDPVLLDRILIEEGDALSAEERNSINEITKTIRESGLKRFKAPSIDSLLAVINIYATARAMEGRDSTGYLRNIADQPEIDNYVGAATRQMLSKFKDNPQKQ